MLSALNYFWSALHTSSVFLVRTACDGDAEGQSPWAEAAREGTVHLAGV